MQYIYLKLNMNTLFNNRNKETVVDFPLWASSCSQSNVTFTFSIYSAYLSVTFIRGKNASGKSLFVLNNYIKKSHVREVLSTLLLSITSRGRCTGKGPQFLLVHAGSFLCTGLQLH